MFLSIDTFLVAMFWKLYLHPMYILKKGNYREIIFIGFHYYMAYQIGWVNYLLSGWLASIYIFGNFALSHTHLPVTSDSLHWVEYALLHTMGKNSQLIRGVVLISLSFCSKTLSPLGGATGG